MSFPNPGPGPCPNCGFNNWRTTGLVRRQLPSGEGHELEIVAVEVDLKHPVCVVCENAARRKQYPRSGRRLGLESERDPDT